MGAYSTDLISGACDVALPGEPFRGRMFIDGAWVEAGTIWINSFMDGYPELRFGGYRESGIGRALGRKALEGYTGTNTVRMHIGARTGWWLPR